MRTSPHLALLMVVALAAACGSENKQASPRGAMASMPQCEAYMRHMMELGELAAGAPPTKPAAASAIIQDAIRSGSANCQRRMTAKQVACALAAQDIETATSCEPEFDPRAPEERPRSGECERLGSHVATLALQARVLHEEIVAEYQRQRAVLVAAPATDDGRGAPSDRIARLDERIDRERGSMTAITSIAAKMRTAAARSCRQGTPRTEVLCSLAADTMRQHAACGLDR